MKCLAIGGCHLTGYPIGYDKSFIYKFSKHFASEIHVEANFPLSHVNRISSLIKAHNPGVVVLQLGNYEFDASIKKTFKLWAKKRMTADCQTQRNAEQITDSGNFSRRLSGTPVIFNNRLLSFFQWLCIPPTSLLRQCLVADHMKILKGEIQEFPCVKFIVLTPLPLEKAADNCVRKRAARYFKKYFANMANVCVIDTHDTLKHPPVFADPSHLNIIGHELLQHAIEEKL